MEKIAIGSRVEFSYRQHHLLGGAQISGLGVVISETIVGNENAYAIKPDNGTVVHVRFAGVRVI